jgi:hypothetical protein
MPGGAPRRLVVPLQRRGEIVEYATAPLACGCGDVRVRLAAGEVTRRCDVCRRSSLVRVHRSAVQEAWVVEAAVLVGQMAFTEVLEPDRTSSKRKSRADAEP